MTNRVPRLKLAVNRHLAKLPQKPDDDSLRQMAIVQLTMYPQDKNGAFSHVFLFASMASRLEFEVMPTARCGQP